MKGSLKPGREGRCHGHLIPEQSKSKAQKKGGDEKEMKNKYKDTYSSHSNIFNSNSMAC